MEAFSLTVSDLQTVILFLLPGFLFLVLFFYQIPDRRKSDLTTVFFSVLASVVIHGISAWVLSVFYSLFHLHLKPPVEDGVFIILQVILSICLSILIVLFIRSNYFRWWSRKIFKVDTAPFGRVWNDFFSVKEITVLRICLDNSLCYIGILDKASIDPNDDIQELILLDPFYYTIKKRKPTVTRIKETSSILLQGIAIKSVEKITYEEARKLYDYLP